MIKRLSSLLLILGSGLFCAAQDRLTENTFKLRPGQQSPPATIADMAWLAGHWKGEAFGGVSEEIWSPPANGSMMGMYRLVSKGGPVFYELMTLVEEHGSLVLRLKHFHASLKGWEEKDKTVDFAFVMKSNGMIHFEGMAFRPDGKDAVTIYVVMRHKDGSMNEEAFRHRRVNARAKANSTFTGVTMLQGLGTAIYRVEGLRRDKAVLMR